MTLKPPLGVNFPDQYTSRAEVIFESPVNVRYPEWAGLVDNGDWSPALNAAADHARTATGGGALLIPSGEYRCESALDFGGLTVEGIPRGAGATSSQTVLRHFFNGDFITFGAYGAQLRNLAIYEGDATLRTGAALAAASTADDIGGAIILEHLTISGAVGWERLMVFDGSAQDTFGIRKIFALNCDLFGARTPGESIVITNGVHVKFVGGLLDQAPTAVQQGVRILGEISTDVTFANFEILGGFYTEATGDLVYMGRITGAVECAPGSECNVFIGRIGGTFSYNGAATNMRIGSGASSPVSPTLPYDNEFSGNQSIGGRVNVEGGLSGRGVAENGVKRVRVTGGKDGAAGLEELYDRLSVSSGHAFGSFPDPGAGAAYIDKGLLLAERTDPAAPAADLVRVYARDNGAGKTELVARFSSGAVQVLATQP